jgi:fumarylacetoacetase
MTVLDETHDPFRRSWVPRADGHPDFPVQNLPFGVFSPEHGEARPGVAIGDRILDLGAVAASNLLSGDALAAAQAAGSTLNAMLGRGEGPRRALRAELSRLLSVGGPAATLAPMLHDAASCTIHLPCAIGDYTDFYVGIHHATNIGKQFRPDNPLLPNYKYIPIGYHGRASSVRPSGTPVRRPTGQTKAPDAAAPTLEPSRRLDYELELGVFIGPGNALGEPVPISDAATHIAGYCLLNDWSARDIQAWEYQPLGPFLSKNFLSTISCWIVTPEALAPFRIPQPARPEGDPAPLPYLSDDADQARGALDLELDVLMRTASMRAADAAPHRVARSNARYMYWTPAQMVAHHTIGGCNLRPGDLLGTGTLSGPGRDECGSILEATLGGREPIHLGDGEERRFLEDGDEVVLRARAARDGFASIGFGECRGIIQPALR